jgi:2',3'-cyclic-nucleotide 2'-phosphodiesterase (5'-nucleotidase family)
MSIDFTMPANVLEIRDKVRAFVREEIERAEEKMMRHARSARLVDGADEVHMTQIARHVIDASNATAPLAPPQARTCCSPAAAWLREAVKIKRPT